MTSCGSWETVLYGQDAEGELNYDYFLWPDPTPNKIPYKIVGTSCNGWIIPTYSKDKADLIAELYDFMLQKDNQKTLAEMGNIPCVRNIPDTELREVWDPRFVRIFNQDVTQYGYGEISDIWLTVEFIDRMTTSIQEVVLGQIDLKTAQRELEKLAVDIRNR
jgi:ABC-type glycerol-3-phosphate transport system substrate-binding protein